MVRNHHSRRNTSPPAKRRPGASTTLAEGDVDEAHCKGFWVAWLATAHGHVLDPQPTPDEGRVGEEGTGAKFKVTGGALGEAGREVTCHLSSEESIRWHSSKANGKPFCSYGSHLLRTDCVFGVATVSGDGGATAAVLVEKQR